MTKIIVVDPGSWSLPYDYFYIQELAKIYHVEFHCSYTRYNGELINGLRQLSNVTVVCRHLSGKRVLGAFGYISMWFHLLAASRRVSTIHFIWSWIPIIDAIFFLFIRKKLVITLHNHRPHKRRHKKYWPFWIQHRLARSTIFASRFTQEKFTEDWPNCKQTQLIPIGASPMGLTFEQDYSPAQVFRPTLIFWGNVKEYKGLGSLLNNYPLLANSGWSLEVYGKFDRECESQLALAKSLSVPVVARFLTAEESIKLLKSGGVMVFPYLGITQSAVMYTAVYYCMPFVCTKHGDMFSFLRENDLEELGFDIDDAQSLLRSLEYVRENYDRIVERLESARGARNWQVPAALLHRIYG